MSLPQRPTPIPQSIEGEALDWFVRRTGGGFDERNEAAFLCWLEADVRHQNAYRRQQAEWAALDRLPVAGLEILRANLADDLASDLKQGQATPASWRPSVLAAGQSRRRFLMPAFAAAAGALVLAGGVGMGWGHWQAQPVFSQNFSTQRGQQLDVPLPDGSQLRLDTATQVEVVYYRQRREIKLSEGQAVFSVQPDAQRPFAVLAGPLRVTVVGTRFSVRHTPGIVGNDGVRVAVAEGRVKVESVVRDAATAASATPIFLSAQQQIAADAQGRVEPVAALSSVGIAPWRDNRVSFDNARLDQVLAELARYGNTGLLVQDPAVAKMRITGTFNPTRMDSFARVLPQAAAVRLRERGEQMEIVRAP